MNQPETKPLILIVDDTPENVDALAGILSDDYRIKMALDMEASIVSKLQAALARLRRSP